jgi:hypothetical protein
VPNPTSQVPGRQLPYGADDKFYLNFPPGQNDLFVCGEMIGCDPATGYAAHFDDTKTLQFAGVFVDPDRQISSDLPAPILIYYKRPRMFTMPLLSGTATRGAQRGAPVYAADSGHVVLSPGALVYGNTVGYFWDVFGSTPETITAPTIWITPEPWGDRMSRTTGHLTAPATGGKTYGIEALNGQVQVPNTAAETFILPPVASTVDGDEIEFIKTTAAAFAFTLQGNGAELINGANTVVSAAAQWSVLKVRSDGTQWIVVAKI